MFSAVVGAPRRDAVRVVALRELFQLEVGELVQLPALLLDARLPGSEGVAVLFINSIVRVMDFAHRRGQVHYLQFHTCCRAR